MKNILDYKFPEDIKYMTNKELELLAVQIREFLIDNISKTGGHLASNLGVVELTIALHKFFNVPNDKIIWDVGHQSYVHKILTGRAENFHTLRQLNGLSGFPKKSESECDCFDTGHSSTSISVATGFAKARDLNDEHFEVVAVIGDGSLTGGLAYEGLNNLGESKSKAIVVLNDNGMSIGQNTGGVSKHLSKLRVSKGYTNFKSGVRSVLRKVPAVGNDLYKSVNNMKEHIKFSIVDGVMFEKLGLTYIGPIDGHNIEELLYNFKLAKESKNSVIMHIVTQKGKGYYNAEKNPSKFHGTGAFDKATGNPLNVSNKKTFSESYGEKLLELAKEDKKIVAVSAAMIDGTGLTDFARHFPNRMFDVGIAEGHAVTFAGAMATMGLKPFVTIYSTFLQRAYDNIIMDVCLQNVPVVFAIDRGGNVGADGETHHGMFDLSYLKNIPNLTVLAPSSFEELSKMMDFAAKSNMPVAIRYPRGASEIDESIYTKETDIKNGANIIKEGKDIVIWSVGNMLPTAIKTKNILQEKGYDVGLVDARWVSPIDIKTLKETCSNTNLTVTLEDNVIEGGFGESVVSILNENKIYKDVLKIGWPKEFIQHGNTKELMKIHKMDEQSIVERIEDLIEK